VNSAIRFDPPAFEPPPGTAWVLRRAFGPVGGGADLEAPAAAVVQLARHLGLAARIGARLGREDLERALGESAALLRRDSAVCAAQAARLATVSETVEEAAAAVGAPAALLKGAALARGGHVALGSRWASDVDVLVPGDRIESLQRELERRGWRSAGRGYEHQLPALVHPHGGAVELHRKLLGVRLGGGRRSAAFADLAGQGLLRPAVGLAGAVFLPTATLLAAHAIAHGLGQHGFEPRSYPPGRLLADLVDLGFGVAGVPTEVVVAWVRRAVPADEVESLAQLCRELVAGWEPPPDEAARRRPAQRLLTHFLAGALLDDYGEALKLRRLAAPLSDAPRPLAVARAAWRALVPARSELEAIYGPPRWRGELWWRRLLRPFDLARRSWRAARARSHRG
jgi:hypothetical protein